MAPAHLTIRSERSNCDYCGAHVTSDFRRTDGTDAGRAKRCPERDSWTRLICGSTYGDDIVLENLDWSAAFEKYDSEETVFYCDPPYVGKEGDYLESDTDHSEFVEALRG